MKKITLLKQFEFKDNENGFYVITTKYGDMIVNDMGKYIVENVVNHNFDDLCLIIAKSFDLDQTDARKKTENFLYELRNVGLIDFQDDTHNSFFNSELQVAGEKNYKVISNDIIESLGSCNTIYTVSTDKKYYNIYALRTRSFSNRENYFFKFNGDKYTIIGVQNLDTPKFPIFISLLKYGENIEELSELFDKLVIELKQLKQYKIRITVNKALNHTTLENFLFSKGFKLEGTLKKEDGINDFFLYGKIL